MKKILPNSWSRIIMHVDMNAFFASIEQRDFSYLRNKPIAVTNGINGSCIITCSYEARASGIKTGMRFSDAKKLCPNLIKRSSRPYEYTKVSEKIMETLYSISPDIEIFSIDEAFIDLTHCQKIYSSPINAAKLTKRRIFNKLNLPCSIGISGNKAVAKFAAKLVKPNGITIINPLDAEKILSKYLVTELCGVSKGIQKFLNYHNVFTCGDMKKIPVSILGNKFGNIGRKIWLMAQGKDIEELNLITNLPKSIGHGKIVKPNMNNLDEIKKIFHHMSEKVAQRMRLYCYESNLFYVGIKSNKKWVSRKFKIRNYSNHGRDIFDVCLKLINELPLKCRIFQVKVTALKPRPINIQQDIYCFSNDKKRILDSAMDEINQRYGRLSLAPARIIDKPESPDVISPSWRPSGCRKSV